MIGVGWKRVNHKRAAPVPYISRMTPHEAFAEGRLAEAVAMQEAIVADRLADSAARLLLMELLLFAGRFEEARSHLAIIESDDPAWPASAHTFRQLVRAERRRSRRPKFPFDPIPRHAKARWLAVKALRDGDPDSSVKWVDRADSLTPEVRGFLDGHGFESLRDADDRFGSVLEAFANGKYVWFPWEAVRRLKFEPAKFALDRFARPAEVRLKDGAELRLHLPLVYPRSHEAEGAFAVGLETDRVCPDGGPIRCVGGKLLLVDDDEVRLGDCRMIEFR